MRLRLIGFLLIFLISISALSASVVSDGRNQNFDQDWYFKKDTMKSGPENLNFDISSWRKVDLPHDWSIEDLPGQGQDSIVGPFSKSSKGGTSTGFTLGGTAWYRKTFKIQKENQNKSVYILFDGVYMNSEVWINGHYLGIHHYGYTPFYYELTPYLVKDNKENIIAVKVRNEGETSRWYSGSGINRHVTLVSVNPVHVDVWGVKITTPEVSKLNSKIRISTIVKNEKNKSSSVTIKTRIIDNKGKIVKTFNSNVVIPAMAKMETNQLISLENPNLWSPDSPYLYQAKTSIFVDGKETDQVNSEFGIRNFQIDAEHGLLINGVSYELKGGCIHHDNGPLGSVSFERAEERKIQILKENGYNAIRTSHNPPSTALLNVCDRMGFLVIEEAFDVWEKLKRYQDYHLYFNEDWNRDIESIVQRDGNHPSVILWSIGNEIPERVSTRGIEITKNLVRKFHELDPTRKVTEAINLTPKWEEKTPPAFAELDVAGYNYEWKRYEPDHEKFPQRVMYASESTPADILDYWNMVEKHPYVIGDFVWTAVDYIGEAGCGSNNISHKKNNFIVSEWPWFNANCGDIDLVGEKKPQSYYRDIVWRRSKIEMFCQKSIPDSMYENVTAWGWPDIRKSWTWPGEEGKSMNVIVYTRCQRVKLELNGKLIAEQNVPENSVTITFKLPYKPGTLVAKGYENESEVASTILETTGEPYGIRLIADRNIISTSNYDLSYVKVEIVDSKGNLVTNAEDIEVNFSIAGNGKIAGVGNGNPIDMSSFQQPRKKVFHGKCLVIVRPDDKKGNIFLEASSKGLKKANIEIKVNQK